MLKSFRDFDGKANNQHYTVMVFKSNTAFRIVVMFEAFCKEIYFRLQVHNISFC